MNQRTASFRPEVVSVCEMLGYYPYFLACEGRIEAGDSRVILATDIGGRRVLDELEDDPLPRICRIRVSSKPEAIHYD